MPSVFSTNHLLNAEEKPPVPGEMKLRRLAGPQNLHDCKTDLRWIRGEAVRCHVDPARMAVMGGSAGGHLVTRGTADDTIPVEGSRLRAAVGQPIRGVTTGPLRFLNESGRSRLRRAARVPRCALGETGRPVRRLPKPP